MQCLITYNPRLIIDEHFLAIIRRIDVRTEKLIMDTLPNEKELTELNDLRQFQINKLNEIKELTLAKNSFTEESFEAKWTDLIYNDSIEYEAKMDLVKHDLIVIDCVLVDDMTSKSKLTLCKAKS